jgi:hypothetical protein
VARETLLSLIPADRSLLSELLCSSSTDRPRPAKLGKDNRSHGGMSCDDSFAGESDAGPGERYSAERSGRRRKWMSGT